MKKLILGAALFSLSVFANANGADVSVAASTDATATEQVTITADKSDVAVAKSNCVKQTGTRVKTVKDKQGCNGLAGNSYDREDIDRTGATTVGEALERLSPIARISR